MPVRNFYAQNNLSKQQHSNVPSVLPCVITSVNEKGMTACVDVPRRAVSFTDIPIIFPSTGLNAKNICMPTANSNGVLLFANSEKKPYLIGSYFTQNTSTIADDGYYERMFEGENSIMSDGMSFVKQDSMGNFLIGDKLFNLDMFKENGQHYQSFIGGEQHMFSFDSKYGLNLSNLNPISNHINLKTSYRFYSGVTLNDAMYSQSDLIDTAESWNKINITRKNEIIADTQSHMNFMKKITDDLVEFGNLIDNYDDSETISQKYTEISTYLSGYELTKDDIVVDISVGTADTDNNAFVASVVNVQTDTTLASIKISKSGDITINAHSYNVITEEE